jgi:hypothetical protein
MQTEDSGHRLHLLLVGLVQPQPHKPVTEFVHLLQSSGVGVVPRQPFPVDVHPAIHGRPRDRHRNPVGIHGR